MNTNTDRLIEALRSGEFSQTTDTIYKRRWLRQDQYCALGVGVELYRRAHDNVGWGDIIRDANDSSGTIAEWLGLSVEDVRGVIWRNDQLLCSFREIADWLECRRLMELASQPEPLDTELLAAAFEADLDELLDGTVFAKAEPCLV